MFSDDFLRRNVPFFTNDRLAVQQSTFVYSLNSKREFKVADENEKVFQKLVVTKELFQQIRKKLNDFNCNSQVLFHGLDG